MPPYASPPMASSSRKEVVFPPLYAPIDWSYAPQNFRPSSNPAAPRARAERHNPYSIATMRIQLARYLLQRLPCCPKTPRNDGRIRLQVSFGNETPRIYLCQLVQ